MSYKKYTIKPLEFTPCNKKSVHCHTPVGYYWIGKDGFMYSPWICKYPDYETAVQRCAWDYVEKLEKMLNEAAA